MSKDKSGVRVRPPVGKCTKKSPNSTQNLQKNDENRWGPERRWAKCRHQQPQQDNNAVGKRYSEDDTINDHNERFDN